MSRMLEDGATQVTESVQTRVIRCPHCSVELNLPSAALGRRLKCPKCEMKFQAPSLESLDQAAGRSPTSSMFLPTRDGSSGSHELPSFASGSGSGDLELPTSLAPLRETFELPLLSDDLPARPSGRQPAGKTEGDVSALFQDEPKTTRKLRGAEARSRARRCPSCSTVVPVGMSLCSRCGLDLDTGQRHSPVDLFEEEMPIARQAPMPPVGILVVGSLCTIGFVFLATLAVVHLVQGKQLASALLLVWLFGLYGSVQFLRQRSIKKVFVGLSLAVVVAAIYLIALPIYLANFPDSVAESSGFTRVEDRINLNQIYFGVGSLLSYAALAVYLNSPSLRRQFHRR